MIELSRRMPAGHVRVYSLVVSRDLFTGHLLEVAHGRAGSRSRRRSEHFDTTPELVRRVRELLARRRRHGYIVVAGDVTPYATRTA